MIARIWHGWTKPAGRKAYEEMLRDEIFPRDYADATSRAIMVRNCSFMKMEMKSNS